MLGALVLSTFLVSWEIRRTSDSGAPPLSYLWAPVNTISQIPSWKSLIVPLRFFGVLSTICSRVIHLPLASESHELRNHNQRTPTGTSENCPWAPVNTIRKIMQRDCSPMLPTCMCQAKSCAKRKFLGGRALFIHDLLTYQNNSKKHL